LTGKHETATIDKFTWGVGNRAASVRVGNEVKAQGRGYLEDRRPSSNCDPYLVTGKLAETVCLPEKAKESEAKKPSAKSAKETKASDDTTDTTE